MDSTTLSGSVLNKDQQLQSMLQQYGFSISPRHWFKPHLTTILSNIKDHDEP